MTFENRVSQNPKGRKLTINRRDTSQDGKEVLYVDIERDEGNVSVAGTPINAQMLEGVTNSIRQVNTDAQNAIATVNQKADKALNHTDVLKNEIMRAGESFVFDKTKYSRLRVHVMFYNCVSGIYEVDVDKTSYQPISLSPEMAGDGNPISDLYVAYVQITDKFYFKKIGYFYQFREWRDRDDDDKYHIYKIEGIKR